MSAHREVPMSLDTFPGETTDTRSFPEPAFSFTGRRRRVPQLRSDSPAPSNPSLESAEIPRRRAFAAMSDQRAIPSDPDRPGMQARKCHPIETQTRCHGLKTTRIRRSTHRDKSATLRTNT